MPALSFVVFISFEYNLSQEGALLFLLHVYSSVIAFYAGEGNDLLCRDSGSRVSFQFHISSCSTLWTCKTQCQVSS